MKDFQPGEILICTIRECAVFDHTNIPLCKISRSEHVTFIKYSDYGLIGGNFPDWIQVLTANFILGDVGRDSFKKAFK